MESKFLFNRSNLNPWVDYKVRAITPLSSEFAYEVSFMSNSWGLIFLRIYRFRRCDWRPLWMVSGFMYKYLDRPSTVPDKIGMPL